MPTITFIGKVLPYGLSLTCSNFPQYTWSAEAIGIDVTLTISILDGDVKVQCFTSNFEDHYLPHLHFRAARLAKACVDLAAFAAGHAAGLVFEEMIEPDGTVSILRYPTPKLASRCTAYELIPGTPAEAKEFNQICRIVLADPSVFLALNDLIDALCSPHNIAANCGRVLDGLRKLVVPDLEPKKAWPIFCNSLRMDETYTKKIRNGTLLDLTK